jgi:hypothetical protein
MTMATKSDARRPDLGHYFELVRRFPLRPLHSDKELSEAIDLNDKRRLTRGQVATICKYFGVSQSLFPF